jgi:drug/metabolite transporter (DMT)-like permease
VSRAFHFEIPIFGALLAALVLGESVLEWKNLVALVLVSAGIWLVTRGPKPSPGTDASVSA